MKRLITSIGSHLAFVAIFATFAKMGKGSDIVIVASHLLLTRDITLDFLLLLIFLYPYFFD